MSEKHLQFLEESALEKSSITEQLAPVDVIDDVTNGLYFCSEEIRTVVLLPSLHASPASVYHGTAHHLFVQYPIETGHLGNRPPSALTRLTKALADEHRLDILRYLHGEPRSFAEIMSYVGLSKTATHYHLSTLRLAGLVRTLINDSESVDKFIQRPGLIERLSMHLRQFISNDSDK